MVEISIPAGEKDERRPRLQSAFQGLREVRDLVLEEIKEMFFRPEILHPEFKNAWKIDERLTWYQNREWGPAPSPPHKIGFYFNDLSTLDGCPWVCKFGNNLNPEFSEYKYFCFVYGDPRLFDKGYDLENVIEWAKKFHHPTLMTFGGKTVRNV